MSFRISFGSAWFSLYIWQNGIAHAKTYLLIQYGHNSTNTVIQICRTHQKDVVLRIGKKKAKTLIRGKK